MLTRARDPGWQLSRNHVAGCNCITTSRTCSQTAIASCPGFNIFALMIIGKEGSVKLDASPCTTIPPKQSMPFGSTTLRPPCSRQAPPYLKTRCLLPPMTGGNVTYAPRSLPAPALWPCMLAAIMGTARRFDTLQLAPHVRCTDRCSTRAVALPCTSSTTPSAMK